MPNVHLAFGFHVNLYHSFRGDTPDDKGFGGDIRVIRNTIRVLDEANRRGAAAKATWDFENVYSLEEILPRYAPDIISGVRRRALQNGDENILMGYNNGAMGALARDEFDASVRWAITNPQGSGLRDVFGAWAPLIRPQEMMFTPTNAGMYRRLGIEGVCLYYSAIPFDGFRTLIPLLPEERMFNPLRYEYGGEDITIIPAINHGDLIDYGSLTYLVKRLHRLQEAGTIQNDVLVFVNMDADSEYWFGYDMPGPLSKIPNMAGLAALIQEVEGLPYVVFDTPYHYLRGHPPAHTLTFAQDIADGSFDGFSSWAEKPFNRLIWSRVERARRFAAAGDGQAGFKERVRLLSTTHFGLSSPVLNADRERTALSLSAEMQQKALAGLPAKEAPGVVLSGDSSFFSCCIGFRPGFLPKGQALRAASEGLLHSGFLPLAAHDDGSVKSGVLLGRYAEPGGVCRLRLPPAGPGTGQAPVKAAPAGHAENKLLQAEGALDANALFSGFITYDGQRVPIRFETGAPFHENGLTGRRFAAAINLPGQLAGGWCRLGLFTLAQEPFLFIHADIQYPTTPEDTAIFNEIAALNRLCDARWQEAAAFQIQPPLGGELSVVKRNFCGDMTSFEVADFRKACPENAELDSFNHQVTGGIVGLRAGGECFLLANARQVLGSMALCPMRLRREEGGDKVFLNPFGTYFGRQRRHPTYGSGLGGEVAVHSAPQYQSLAPAYNGARETLLLAAVLGAPGPGMLCDLAAFADGAPLVGGGPEYGPCRDDFVQVHAPANAPDSGKKSMTRSIPAGLQARIALNSLASRWRR